MPKLLLGPALAGLIVLTSCAPAADPAPDTRQWDVLHTLVQLTFYQPVPEGLYDTMLQQMQDVDALMSDYDATSEVSRVSAASGGPGLKVSAPTLKVIQRGLHESEVTGGVFDPTIGPVTHLWDISGKRTTVPTAAEIAAARALVNYRDVLVDTAAQTVSLKKKGMILDLGGIAKGYALDEIMATARKAGMTAGLFSMGSSSIGVMGKKPGGKLWKIGVKDPFGDQGGFFAVIEGHDMTVETSGPYEKFSILDGKRYGHIMDPRTGAPADTGLEQVTLVLPLDTELPDGLSTSCFILGLEKGLALIESLPGASAVFVTSDHKVHLSSRMGPLFTLKDTSFEVVR